MIMATQFSISNDVVSSAELDIYVNNLLTSLDFRAVTGHFTRERPTSQVDLSKYTKCTIPSRIAIYYDGYSVDRPKIRPFLPSFTNYPDSQLMILKGSFNLTLIDSETALYSNLNTIIIAEGHPSLLIYVDRFLDDKHSIVWKYPKQTFLKNLWPVIGVDLLSKPTYLLIGNITEITTLAYTKNAPWLSKVVSVLYLLFPYVRNAFENLFVLIPMRDFQTIFEVAPVNANAAFLANIEKKIQLMIALSLLTFAYKHENKLSSQLFLLIKAALSGTNYSKLTQQDIDVALREFGFKPDLNLKIIDVVIGHVIAVDKTRKYNPLVKYVDTLTPSMLYEDPSFNVWTIKIFEQAKMIYFNHHGQTIRLGVSVVNALDIDEKTLPLEWQIEIKYLKSIERSLSESPYIGLQHYLPEKFRVARAPRMCLFGVLFLESCFGSEGKSKFQHYKKSLYDHIPSGEKSLFPTLLDTFLPMQDNNVIACIIKALGIRRAQQLMATLSKEKTEAIYCALHQEAKDKNIPDHEMGQWYIHTKSATRLDTMTGTVKELNKKVDEYLEEKLLHHRMKLEKEPSAEKRSIMIKQLSKWEEGIRENISHIETIDKQQLFTKSLIIPSPNLLPPTLETPQIVRGNQADLLTIPPSG
ncbi:uncharacterized protein LOC135929545 isoform X1 [Gordionus sp. m RMFG-2023]|uniref:uncharacterized protein LOC135929545 isoform X1 n=2 Tax=Gordionus sp. m RMFG-2023 TaxID=3053472 RepID=UPI0031FCE707